MVRDNDYRRSGIGKVAEFRQQLVHFKWRQGSSRLIKYQRLRTQIERTEYFNTLLLSHRQLCNLISGTNRQAITICKFF